MRSEVRTVTIPHQSALWPNSRKLVVSWPSSCYMRRIEQTREDKWFLDHKIFIIDSISKTYGHFAKFSFSIHAFSRDVMSIHCVQVRPLVFALDTSNVMAKNIKRKSLGGEKKHDVFCASLYFFVLIKCCSLNIHYFDLR